MISPNRRSTAYHEAAHAIACHILNRKIFWIFLSPTDDRHGGCSGNEYPLECEDQSKITPEIEEEEAMIHLAGIAAEEIHNGLYDKVYARHDLKCARKYIKEMLYWMKFLDPMEVYNPEEPKISEEEIKDCLLIAKEKVKILLQNHWVALEVLAEELLNSQKIEGPEVHAIILELTGIECPDSFS